MSKILENLRAKSETYRRTVAFVTSLVITLAIGIIWASVILPGSVSNQTTLAKNPVKNGPTASFRKNFAQSFEAIRMQWDSLSGYLKETKYEAGAELQVISPEQKAAETRAAGASTNTENPARNNGNYLIE